MSRQNFENFLKSWDETVPKAVKVSEGLKSELELFGDIKQSLADVANIASPNVHFYGARVIGTATAESDLDIYVDVRNHFYDGISREMQKMYLSDFEQKLSLNPKWKVELAICDETVPALRLIYVSRNIKCE